MIHFHSIRGETKILSAPEPLVSTSPQRYSQFSKGLFQLGAYQWFLSIPKLDDEEPNWNLFLDFFSLIIASRFKL